MGTGKMYQAVFCLLIGLSVFRLDVVTGHRWCEDWEFTCQNGDCVRNIYVCDGNRECQDGSDEEYCPHLASVSSTTTKYTAAPCPEGYFQCTNGRCIPYELRCDGNDDCIDGSDEMNCPIEEPPTPMPLGVSAIIGIAVAVVCLLFLATTGGIVVYYQRRKRFQRARAATPEFVGPLEDLPYDLPPEAMMRVPPPRYTSQDALAIVNPGYRDDEPTARPPPYYASRLDMSRMSLYDSLEPPPSYTSRLELRPEDEMTLAGNERMGSSTTRSQGNINITAISSGILNESIASALTLNNTLICNTESPSYQQQVQRRGSSCSSSNRGSSKKRKRTDRDAVEEDKISKRLSMSSSALLDPRVIENLQFTSLDGLKGSEPRSLSFQIEEALLVEKPNLAAPVHRRDKADQDTKAVFRHSKYIAKSSPCLDFADKDFKFEAKEEPDSCGCQVKTQAGSDKRREKVSHKSKSKTSSRSSPKKTKKPSKTPGEQEEVPKDIRITANPDLAAWRAQILACSSQDPVYQDSSSVHELEDIPELDDTLTNCSNPDTSMGRAQTVQGLQAVGLPDQPNSRPGSFRSRPGTARQISASVPQLYSPGQKIFLGSTTSLDTPASFV